MQNEDLKILAHKNALQNPGNLVSMCYPFGGVTMILILVLQWQIGVGSPMVLMILILVFQWQIGIGSAMVLMT